MKTLIIAVLCFALLASLVTPACAKSRGDDDSGWGGLIIIGIIVFIIICKIASWGNEEEKKGTITITETRVREVSVSAKRFQKVDMNDVTRQVINGSNPQNFRIEEGQPQQKIEWRIDENS